jgi:hypothetical protein
LRRQANRGLRRLLAEGFSVWPLTQHMPSSIGPQSCTAGGRVGGVSRGGWAEGQRPRRSLGGSWGHSVRAAVIRRHPDFKEALAAHDIAEAQVLGDNRRGFLKPSFD